jgi:hypothetical protein
MTDNGLAALAAALEAPLLMRGVRFYGPIPPEPLSDLDMVAAAILGERGVFLPDGLLRVEVTSDRATCNHIGQAATIRDLRDKLAVDDEIIPSLGERLETALATIATLRAALDGVQAIIDEPLSVHDHTFDVDGKAPVELVRMGAEVAAEDFRGALRAALATAKETP